MLDGVHIATASQDRTAKVVDLRAEEAVWVGMNKECFESIFPVCFL